MKAPIDPKEAKEWFGGVPPDLTLIARSRAGHGGTGADYLYTYMRTFYRDARSPPAGTTWPSPTSACRTCCGNCRASASRSGAPRRTHGHDVKIFKGWKQVSPGTMTPLQYDQAVGDLVGYLQWMAEPAQNQRVRIGAWVLLFLGVLPVIVWRLNAAFWKDVR